jgi:uncharacterized protein (UPF0332 family)
MTTNIDMQVLLEKAAENLASAISEHANRRYNACANRAYYACFQAGIVALMRAGIGPTTRQAEWGHGFVQAQFAGELIGRRKQYPAALRDALPRLLELRERADYETTHVSQIQAARALTRAREFIAAVLPGGDRS